MEVQIGTVISNVQVSDGSGSANTEEMDRIVRRVVEIVLESLRQEQQSRQLGQIPERMANTDPF
jgi:hypothetical protein